MSDRIYIGPKEFAKAAYDIVAETPSDAAVQFDESRIAGPYKLIVHKRPDALDFFNELRKIGSLLYNPKNFWSISQTGRPDSRIEHPSFDELKKWALDK